MIENIPCIGDGWGKQAGVEGPEHFWKHGTGATRRIWATICGMEVVEANDSFSGIPILHLTMERNPLAQNRCEFCLAVKNKKG